MQMRLDCLPDPYDARDVPFSALGYSPTGGDIELSYKRVVRNQVGGSCVGNALVQAVQLQADLAGIPCPDLSAQYVYRMARWLSQPEYGLDREPADIGTWPRAAFTALSRWGACPETSWPADDRTLNAEPNALAKLDAANWRAQLDDASYHRVNTMRDIDVALDNGMPVVAGWWVGDEIFKPTEPIGEPRNRAGRHAMVIVGRIGSDYVLLNSWGAQWGNNGRWLFKREFVSQFGDAWTGRLSWK